ncbi:thioesterase-like superfamily-domain-containing protein [Mycena rosella]|uniref:Thioesterase-like superfamily-domain-containing protein n=1 Tax=Mycena rosella TaxID=1033263 RepID=A0AAD7GQT0_MYCRO|nr:thioesterase-like superfamily-domain-containing protein [Mycena rosella]
MALLAKAICVEKSSGNDSESYFRGVADPEWVIGHVPNGGYILFLIVQSCIQNQAGSSHPDPLHMSAHFLQATKPISVEVKLRILKRGRNFVNILADLVQGDHICITAHLIFGKISPSTRPLIDPSSGYSRRHPLRGHPSNAVLTNMPKMFGVRKQVRRAEDPYLLRNGPEHGRTSGGGVAVWGAWVELIDKEERITPASLAFLADCTQSFATLVPPSVTGINPHSLWLPSLTISLEYKAPIPPPSAMHSARTVGVYIIGGFLSEPQGRHDTCVEIWTAPSTVGEGAEVDGWRDAQVCIGVATQMQLMVAGSVNEKAAKL